jgi:uncharacterized protein involved in response to NO
MLTGAMALPIRFDPVSWHIHEMLFGFVMAVVAGFLLTAIPNWTGRPPISGRALGMLAGLWLIGRVACLVSAVVPAWVASAADLSFTAVLIAVVAHELVGSRNWRNLPMVAPLAVLGLANLLMHLEANGIAVPAGLGWHLALAAVIILISVIGGRVIPSFTRNWLVKRGAAKLPGAHGPVDAIALFALHSGLLAWALLPNSPPVGMLLIAGAALNLWRLCRWRGAATAAEPLLLILHLGYGWLILGVALLGTALLTAAIPLSAGVHALTAGAIGTMTLGMMTRVSRGHTGRELTADGITNLIYVAVNLAAATRLAAAFDNEWPLPLLIVSGGLWIFAFLLFAFCYGRMLTARRLM